MCMENRVLPAGGIAKSESKRSVHRDLRVIHHPRFLFQLCINASEPLWRSSHAQPAKDISLTRTSEHFICRSRPFGGRIISVKVHSDISMVAWKKHVTLMQDVQILPYYKGGPHHQVKQAPLATSSRNHPQGTGTNRHPAVPRRAVISRQIKKMHSVDTVLVIQPTQGQYLFMVLIWLTSRSCVLQRVGFLIQRL